MCSTAVGGINENRAVIKTKAVICIRAVIDNRAVTDNRAADFTAACASVPALKPLVFWLLALLSLGFSMPGDAADAQATEKQVRQLQADIGKLEAQLRQFKGQSQSVERELRRTEKEASQLHRAIGNNEQAISQSRRQLQSLQQERQRLDQARRQQQQVMARQLAAAYRIGRQDQLQLLLNQQQPERISRLMRYYEYLNRSRIDAIELFEQTLASLDQVELDINAQQQQLQSQQQRLKSNSEQLQATRRQRKTTLQQLRQQISSSDQQLGRLKADRGRLRQVLEQLRQTLEQIDLAWESKEFRQLRGRLKWPTSGKVVRTFGSQTALGVKSEGILIGAPAGRGVKAVHHGRVVFSDWLRGFGLLLIVDHGGGYMSLYGHNQALLKEVGDWVDANEKIATVGDSGGLSRTGLYFAIRHNGQPSNPQPWLSRSRG